jgi:hypothetical protein
MSKQKLRIANTDVHNLVSNLRGEVGEVITDWIVLRRFMALVRQLSTAGPRADLENPDLAFASLMQDKLQDELTGRLSELAERKIGQLTFFFASQKLDALHEDAEKFERFVIKTGIREKRNLDVSHKTLPEKWTEHRHRFIDYPLLMRAVAMAVSLMKRIDRISLGPSAPYLWREARKKRYALMSPPRTAYLLLPYLRLSGDDRIRVVQQELDEGFSSLSVLDTMLNGQPAKVLASKPWGVLVLGDTALPVEHYPLHELKELNFNAEPSACPGKEADDG